MPRKTLVLNVSVRADPGDGRLVIVPDDESALLLKHAADAQFTITAHAHDRVAALEEAGKLEEAVAAESKDASVAAAVEKMLADKEAANAVTEPAPDALRVASTPEVK